jgi:UDP-N-acetylglucosamine diphosphorylase/glucosamine-1-phosphate N-acetyltransferase
MNYILFDDDTRLKLLPFTHTRPVADIRCGIFTMRERWEQVLSSPTSTITEKYLQQVFPNNSSDENVYINGSVFATAELADGINSLQIESCLVNNDLVIAIKSSNASIGTAEPVASADALNKISYKGEVRRLANVWDIFAENELQIKKDFLQITSGRQTADIPSNVIVSGQENLFIDKGAKINAGVIINAEAGPVYIGEEAEIMEGAMLRGPLAIGKHAVIKMGAKIYGGTTIGPGCKVGGEISNSVFFANSNKAHDGFIGNSVIGEWCNLGADTNCSNLKNNYDEVKIWDEAKGTNVSTGRIFCGLMMGDHSKCGINTMFNTGTVVGVSANIFGGGFPEKFIPSFSWGGADQLETYRFEKAMETARKMMERRNIIFTDAEIEMYRQIFQNTSAQRS